MNSDPISAPVLDSQRVTLLVNSCDAYRDVWPLFFRALEEWWPNRTFQVVLNTESQSVDFDVPNLKVHTFPAVNGRDQWGQRLLSTLGSIESEYVMVVYDDFILEATFDVAALARLVECMDQDHLIAVCYLTHMGLESVEGDERCGMGRVLDTIEYRLNSAPALWRRKDLMRYTGEVDTPWAWEVFGSYRTYGDGRLFYSPLNPQKDLYHYNHSKGGAIYRGRWVAEVVAPKNERYQLGIDLNKRGLSVEGGFEKRTLSWKLKFLWLGFRMVGFKSLHFIFRALSKKLK